jgi:PAS domain S-box-containing protein
LGLTVQWLMDLTSSIPLPDGDLLLFKFFPQNVLLISRDFKILEASDTYLMTTGKRREDIKGKPLFEVFPESPQWALGQNGDMRDSLNRAIQSRQLDELPVIRFDVPDKDGSPELNERYWKTINQPVTDENEEIICLIHHTQDVTAQVLAERKLQQTLEEERNAALKTKLLSEQMAKLFEDIPAQIAIVKGDDLVYDYINPQYKNELFPERDVLGLPLLVALPEIKDQPIWDILQSVLQNNQVHIEKELHVPLASVTGGPVKDHYFNSVYQPLENEHGEVYGLLSFKYEVTEHVLARQRLEANEQKLTNANENLERSVVELEALQEELRAANEELLSGNEELQSAQLGLQALNTQLEERVAERTKQLEGSFEEQQALNEEISASNEELAAANEELLAINEDLEKTRVHLDHVVAGLSESEGRFRNLVRDATVGIILLTGENLKAQIVNDVYGRLIGRTVEQLEGKPLFDIIPEAEDVFRPIIERVKDSGEALYLYDQPYVVNNGNDTIEGYLDLVYQPYREVDGSISGVIVLCQDVTAQLKARLVIQQSEERMRFILNAMPQQVWTALPDGSLNYVNDIVANDFGYDNEEIVGHGWQRFIHPDDFATCISRWKSSLATGKNYQIEFRLLMKDGSYVWHLARAVPFIENGRISLWMGTNTNIDLQKRNEYKKDEFLSIASHELKTPLTSIKAFNQLMQGMKDPTKLHGFINKSANHIQRLEKLINDLLDVTKINAGKMSYEFISFDFTQMLVDAVESVQLKTELHHVIVEHADAIIYEGDKLRLEQVINNFLTNAVKYSPGGGRVLINAHLQEDSIIVSVQDFGIGIDEEHLDKLFDRYYRVDNTAMRFEGLGLGLFISSEVLKRHNGTFWIESEKGTGTTIFFRLPIKQTHEDIPAIDDHIYYKDDSITIIHNEAAARLDVDWTGFQDVASVKKGCMLMLKMLKYNKVSKVLNDNTHVLGNWSEAADWAGKEWFPMMEHAGLKHFAWIYSPNSFSKLSAEKSVDVMLGNVVTQFFTDWQSAEIWLMAQDA